MSSFAPHFMAGLITGGAVAGISYAFTEQPTALSTTLPFVAGVIGALAPDMDIKSKSSQILYCFFASVATYFFFTGKTELAFLILLYSIFPQFFAHRGFIHSLIFAILSTAALYACLIYLLHWPALFAAIAYFFGFLTHKALDE